MLRSILLCSMLHSADSHCVHYVVGYLTILFLQVLNEVVDRLCSFFTPRVNTRHLGMPMAGNAVAQAMEPRHRRRIGTAYVIFSFRSSVILGNAYAVVCAYTTKNVEIPNIEIWMFADMGPHGFLRNSQCLSLRKSNANSQCLSLRKSNANFQCLSLRKSNGVELRMLNKNSYSTCRAPHHDELIFQLWVSSRTTKSSSTSRACGAPHGPRMMKQTSTSLGAWWALHGPQMMKRMFTLLGAWRAHHGPRRMKRTSTSLGAWRAPHGPRRMKLTSTSLGAWWAPHGPRMMKRTFTSLGAWWAHHGPRMMKRTSTSLGACGAPTMKMWWANGMMTVCVPPHQPTSGCTLPTQCIRPHATPLRRRGGTLLCSRPHGKKLYHQQNIKSKISPCADHNRHVTKTYTFFHNLKRKTVACSLVWQDRQTPDTCSWNWCTGSSGV